MRSAQGIHFPEIIWGSGACRDCDDQIENTEKKQTKKKKKRRGADGIAFSLEITEGV